MTPIENPASSLLNEGIISANPKGFGFVRVVDGDDLFVPPPFMKSLVPGDRVRFHRDINARSNQPFAAIDEVLFRPETHWLGQVEVVNGQTWFRSDDALTPSVRVKGAPTVDVNDVIQVRIPEGAQVGNTTLNGHFVRNLGPRNVPDFDVRYAIAKWLLPEDFSIGEVMEAQAFAEPNLAEAVASGHADLTHLPFVTIDGESTRDFDDAVCIQGSSLWVAIADVAHYVQPGSVLDRCALERGTSVYLPDRVLPMLPPALSTGLCSLNPGVLRLALVCELTYDEAGARTAYRFLRAVIRSHARLTYAQVAVDNYEGCEPEVAPMLAKLKSWYALQEPGRKDRGLMEYRSSEPKLAVADDGSYGIEWDAPLSSHALVEECMLAANRAAAEQLKSQSAAQLFRHQPGPDPEKWDEAVSWMSDKLGKSGVNPTLGELRELLESTEDADLRARLGFRLRRTMVQAIYDAEQSSHFSLNFEAYTHFTSPIRRYPDLLVHRMLLDATYVPPAEAFDHVTAMSRRAKVSSRYPWERMKRRLLWNSGAREVSAQVIGQSARSCRVSVQDWDVLSIVPAQALEAYGLQWDRDAQAWANERGALDDGMMVKVRLSGLVEDGSTLELESSLEGAFA